MVVRGQGLEKVIEEVIAVVLQEQMGGVRGKEIQVVKETLLR